MNIKNEINDVIPLSEQHSDMTLTDRFCQIYCYKCIIYKHNK